MTDPKQPSPKEALEGALEFAKVYGPGKCATIDNLKAAIPVAKLQQKAWDRFLQPLADIHDYRHSIEENDVDLKRLAKKAFEFILEMEALKAKEE